MGRILSVNDDNIIPGTIVCVWVGCKSEPDQLDPLKSIERLRCWSAVAGRMEAGKWTREKRRNGSTATSFFEWLNYARTIGKPTWLFSEHLTRTLTVLSHWSLMESGEFIFNRRPRQVPDTVRSPSLRAQMSRITPGLLIDTDPPAALICYHKSGCKLCCLDLRNYTDKPWSDVCATLGATQSSKPTDSSTEAHWLAWCDEQAGLLTRCIVDLAGWHRRQELGRFGFTVAGIALASFRHRFMCHDVELPDDTDTSDFQRAAYYNGMVRAFWTGRVSGNVYDPQGVADRPDDLFGDHPRGLFHLLDARSFYGAVEEFSEVPVRQIGAGDNSRDVDFPPEIDDGSYLATVRIRSRSEDFPVRLGDRTIWATGEFETTLCGPELTRAITTGSVVAMGRWQRFELALALRPYAMALWKERERLEAEGNFWLAHVVKGMMARLHGKFLQKRSAWENVPEAVAPEAWSRWYAVNATTGRWDRYRSIGWDCQRSVDAGDAPHCFPAIAAWVTATGREWLRTWIKFAGPKNVLYCATDSLIVTDEGRSNLERRGILGNYGIGSMRLQVTADTIDIRGVNNLSIGDSQTLSGVPAGYTEVAPGRGIVTKYDRLGLCWANRKSAGLHATTRVQVLPRPFVVGTIGRFGWITPPALTPGSIGEWEEKCRTKQAATSAEAEDTLLSFQPESLT